jgi:hypothetical protein
VISQTTNPTIGRFATNVALQFINQDDACAGRRRNIDHHGNEGEEVKVEALVEYLDKGQQHEPALVADGAVRPLELLVDDLRLPGSRADLVHG